MKKSPDSALHRPRTASSPLRTCVLIAGVWSKSTPERPGRPRRTARSRPPRPPPTSTIRPCSGKGYVPATTASTRAESDVIPESNTSRSSGSPARYVKNGSPNSRSKEGPALRTVSSRAAEDRWNVGSVSIRTAACWECGTSVRRASPVGVRWKAPARSSRKTPRVAR
ncbi:hypothetical protein A7J05_12280 [Streptomyces alfalfae]|uniref:Uncharacterized protein n=1 Tax=Streptomyces alfalfae TaxID=1642299 RepID=A0ABN4VMK5_9ACTN|nr:hypothetical protein A7J05_12280 [Streptomyces alfalfae]